MTAFLETAFDNPVFAGNFQAVFSAFARGEQGVVPRFPGLLPKVLEHINLLGAQQLLYDLVVEFPDEFALPGTGEDGLVLLAETAAEWSAALSEGDAAAEARLAGLLSALLIVVTEVPERLPGLNGGAAAAAGGETLAFVRPLVEAVFAHPGRPLIFRVGLHVLEKIVHYVEQRLPAGEPDDPPHAPHTRNPVSEYLAAFGERFMAGQPSEEAAVAAFPLLWAAAFDSVFDRRFWEQSPGSSALGEALRLRTVSLDWHDVPAFLRRHRVVETIVQKIAEKENMENAIILPKNKRARAGDGGPYCWTNPFILEIVRFICRRDGKNEDVQRRGIEISLTDEEKETWDRLSEVLNSDIIEYFDHVKELDAIIRNP
jgi:hypothetical protein